MPDVTKHLGRIPAQHRNKPKFVVTVEASTSPFAEALEAAQGMVLAFDLDIAVGQQLDAIGVRVGRSRFLVTPIPSVFFSFDITGLGLDEGVWRGPFDTTSTLARLPDEPYRTLLRAKVANNSWDGSMPDAKRVLDLVYAPLGLKVFLNDNQDMTFTVGVIGEIPDPVTRALIVGGYLNLKPAGVRIKEYASDPDGPIFGFDQDNDLIGGFDSGRWGQPLE